MSDTHNANEGRRGRQHEARPDPAGMVQAQGTEHDREEVKRKQDEANEARNEQIKQAEDKAKELREKTHEAVVKRDEDEFKRREESYDKQRETLENRRKDEARRAAMSPAQRQEEDDKIANMKPDERAKYFLESGRTIPLEQEGGIITPFAGTPSYPILYQHQPPTEFVLSEANGQRSRGNCYLADPVMVYSGSLLKETAPATQLMPPTYVLATAGADADAIALYGGTSNGPEGLRISAIVRDAEVNKHCVTWAPLAGAEIDAAIAQLATKGILCR